MTSVGGLCMTIQKELRSYDAPSRKDIVVKTEFRLSNCKDNVIRSPLPDVKIPDETVPEYVWKNVEKYSNYTALTCGISGRSYTYRVACGTSSKFGAALLKIGLMPRDVVAVMLPNMPEYPFIVLGALEAGYIISTINPLYTKSEDSQREMHSNTTIAGSNGERGYESAEYTELPIVTISYNQKPLQSEGCWDFNDLISASVDESTIGPRAAVEPHDIAVILFSSGTTGLSKGVALSHRNLVANIEQWSSKSLCHHRETSSQHQDVVPAILPFFHVYGLATLMSRSLSLGLHLITLPKFEPTAYIKILPDQKPLSTICYCVPPMIMFLASHPMVKSEHLKSVRFIATGAAPVALQDIQRLLSKLPNRKDVQFINITHGLTECSPTIFAPTILNTELTSVGYPLPNTQIRLVNSSGKNVGPGQSGEIYVKGPQVMVGYYKNDQANAEAFDGEWFKTGDVAYYDEKRRFYIVERLKDLIKVKGFQVAPAELEAVLKSHPHVADVGVIGVPDDRAGEKPIACVVPQPNCKFEPDKVSDFMAEQVAPFKKLGNIIVVKKIPKTPTGKILRRHLKAQYLKEHNMI